MGAGVTRRGLIAAALALPRYELAVDVSIWLELFERQKIPLAEGLPEVLATARKAGFLQVELNEETAALAGAGAAVVRVDGSLQKMLDVAKRTGCKAIVHRPAPQRIRKTDAELEAQIKTINEAGRELKKQGAALWIHARDPREFSHILENLDPEAVKMSVDLDGFWQADVPDPVHLLRVAGSRVGEIRLRNSSNKLWSQCFEPGDIDYRAVAGYLLKTTLRPLLTVDLAWTPDTPVTRPLEENLRRSREYAAKLFKL